MKKLGVLAAVFALVGSAFGARNALEYVAQYPEEQRAAVAEFLVIQFGHLGPEKAAVYANGPDVDMLMGDELAYARTNGTLQYVCWVLENFSDARDTYAAGVVEDIQAGELVMDLYARNIILANPGTNKTAMLLWLSQAYDYKQYQPANATMLRVMDQVVALTGAWTFEGASMHQLMEVLLSDDGQRDMGETQRMKEALRDKIIKESLKSLRSEGKSFVTPADGANPIVAKMAPIIAMLNGPCLADKGVTLEAALREWGVKDVPDIDRSAITALAAQYEDKIMSGVVDPNVHTGMLGVLAIVKGVDGYNEFVRKYNEGEAVGEGIPVNP